MNRTIFISARSFARKIRLAYNTFLKALESNVLVPQRRSERENGSTYGFHPGYVADVQKLLPEERKRGFKILSPEVVKKIRVLNKKWKERTEK